MVLYLSASIVLFIIFGIGLVVCLHRLSDADTKIESLRQLVNDLRAKQAGTQGYVEGVEENTININARLDGFDHRIGAIARRGL